MPKAVEHTKTFVHDEHEQLRLLADQQDKNTAKWGQAREYSVLPPEAVTHEGGVLGGVGIGSCFAYNKTWVITSSKRPENVVSGRAG